MAEYPPELKKLLNIATDMDLAPKIRTDAINQIARMGTREALLALLELIANEALVLKERNLALKRARGVLKQSL